MLNRKRQYNSISSGGSCSDYQSDSSSDTTTNGNVKVVVRIRPENGKEMDGGFKTVVQAMDENVLVFDPKEEVSPDYFHGKRRRGRDILKRQNKDMRFAFDRVFDNQAANKDVYEHTTKAVLDGLLDGFNCSVFAYGATGAGKTHSMLGNKDNPGVIFLTMMDLYDRIENMKDEKICDVAVSYLEVYNEQIRDLLMPSGQLPIREDPQKGVVISGLSLHKPHTAEELMHMLEFGNQNRTQHPTDANAESSRSHAVFQVFVRQKDRTANISTDVRVAKMCLIDLAGSERATVTTNRGARFREGANINRSLLALGNCINALAEGKLKGKHIPYRNSKLTRLLKDSLGGNCRTVMIAAVSPSAMTYEDTYNTLKYANRAKNIKSYLKRNVVSVDFHIHRYAQICDDLRQEVSQLKEKLKAYEDGTKEPITKAGKPDTSFQDDLNKYQSLLHDVFNSRLSIRKEMLEYESSDRDLTLKISQKEKALSRLQMFALDQQRVEKMQTRIQRYVKAAKARQSSLHTRNVNTQERMQDNEVWLQKVDTETNQTGQTSFLSEMMDTSLRMKHLEVELRDTKRYVKYLRKIARALERETQTNEKLILSLLSVAKGQYLVLKGQGLATSENHAEIDSVMDMLGGEKEVAWADQSMQGDVGESALGDQGQATFNRLLEFPVLSCVTTTPKTPRRHRINGVSTPCSAPTSSRKGGITPSHENHTATYENPTAAVRVLAPEPEIGAPQRLADTPVKKDSELVENTNNVVNESQQNAVGLNAILSLEAKQNAQASPRNNTVTVCHTPVAQTTLPKGIGNTVTKDKGSISFNLPVVDSEMECNNTVPGCDIQEQSLNGTFVLDGVQPLNASANIEGVKPIDTPAKSSLQTDAVVTVPEEQGNTFTVKDCDSLKTQTVDTGNDDSKDNAQVHEKKTCDVVVQNTQQKPVNKHISRAIVFDGIAQSPSKMSFADAVKSPARPRQPVADMQSSDKNSRRVTFAMPSNSPILADSSNTRASTTQQLNLPASTVKNISALQRMGLPSMVSKTGSVAKTPKYMQLTAAAANKRRRHGRSWSSKENTTPDSVLSRSVQPKSAPRRVNREEELHRTKQGLSHFRSKSVTHVHKNKGWQL